MPCSARLRADQGSLLVFLPGAGEIRRTETLLKERVSDTNVDIVALFGALDAREQDRAISPAPPGRRKVVLATSIAETSLTIEGVRVVIDSGLSRGAALRAGCRPHAAGNRARVARGCDQRRGRAGRTEPGVCYRLWDEPQTGSLEPYTRPEIFSADLSSFVLDLAQWGASDPGKLAFLDPPPQAALSEARALLTELGAIDAQGRITEEGRTLARAAVAAAAGAHGGRCGGEGAGELAAQIAAVLTERGLGGDDVDLRHRLDQFRRDRSRRAEEARAMVKRWIDAVGGKARGGDHSPGCAARARLSRPHREKSRRRQRRVPAGQWPRRQCRCGFGAVARAVSGGGGIDRRRGGEPHRAGGADRARRNRGAFCRQNRGARNGDLRYCVRLVARAALAPAGRAGAGRADQAVEPDGEARKLLAEGIAALGIGRLPWSKAQLQLRNRVQFLRRAEGEEWPDLSDEALARNAAEWLAPLLADKTALAQIGADDLSAALDALLPWNLRKRLDAEAPTHFTAPSGSAVPIDYEAEQGPTVSIRVQELFGLATPSGDRRRPRAAGDRIAVAGAPAGAGDARSARLLARQLRGGENRDARPLSAPSLAGRSAAPLRPRGAPSAAANNSISPKRV